MSRDQIIPNTTSSYFSEENKAKLESIYYKGFTNDVLEAEALRKEIEKYKESTLIKTYKTNSLGKTEELWSYDTKLNKPLVAKCVDFVSAKVQLGYACSKTLSNGKQETETIIQNAINSSTSDSAFSTSINPENERNFLDEQYRNLQNSDKSSQYSTLFNNYTDIVKFILSSGSQFQQNRADFRSNLKIAAGIISAIVLIFIVRAKLPKHKVG